MKQRGLTRAVIAATCIVTSASVAGCSSGTENDNGAPAPTTAATDASFPYPGLQFRWDIAVPLDENASAAATFALETEALESRMRVGDYNSLLPQMNARVSWDNRPFPDGLRVLPETGGSLTRAVAVDGVGDGRWVVTYCVYNTPGAYTKDDAGSLKLSLPDWLYSAYRSNVALTEEKSGSGETSATPRLLVVSKTRDGFPSPLTRLDDRETCQPFMPEPFIQQPPAPILAGK
ncbi:hypothetical protein ACWIGI_39535 [Nocardia sp. NPDC055321]